MPRGYLPQRRPLVCVAPLKPPQRSHMLQTFTISRCLLANFSLLTPTCFSSPFIFLWPPQTLEGPSFGACKSNNIYRHQATGIFTWKASGFMDLPSISYLLVDRLRGVSGRWSALFLGHLCKPFFASVFCSSRPYHRCVWRNVRLRCRLLLKCVYFCMHIILGMFGLRIVLLQNFYHFGAWPSVSLTLWIRST